MPPKFGSQKLLHCVPDIISSKQTNSTSSLPILIWKFYPRFFFPLQGSSFKFRAFILIPFIAIADPYWKSTYIIPLILASHQANL